jgi:hypothetical protein
MILKVWGLLLFAVSVSHANFMVKISYQEENGRTIKVKNISEIPECPKGEVRIRCEPSAYLAMLGPYVVSYSKCYTKEDLEVMSWYEKFKLCPFGRKSMKEYE